MKRTPLKRSVRLKSARRSPIRRKKASDYVKRKKKTKIGILREWLVPIGIDSVRFKGNMLRSVYWYWLSRDVRKSEWEKWDKLCLTCLRPIENWEDGHCGHVIASAGCGEYLRFHRSNLTLQHAACNSDRITPMAAALNAIHYDERYGKGAWDKLYALRKIDCKEPKQSEYPDLIRALPSYQEALLKNGKSALESPQEAVSLT